MAKAVSGSKEKSSAASPPSISLETAGSSASNASVMEAPAAGALSPAQLVDFYRLMYASRKIDDREMTFLNTINKKAKTKSPEFEKLFTDCDTKHKKAAKK